MPFRTLAFSALLLSLVSACDSQKPAVDQPALTSIDPVQFAMAPDSVFFQLRRTPCFGTCPAYTITILGNGRATYSGHSHVERKGEYNGQVDASIMRALYDRATSISFFEFEDKYDGPVTDLPSTIIRVSANGRDKRVVGRVKPPAAFKAFATYADTLLAGVKWMPVDIK
ncbi:MAG TPA: DUF6438 domain-containing protein [Flavobacteriales bacterium]|nr:hypothetical protein [Flavobacteriales bacterium]MCC6655933.1 hypothetical protein [Flavobacteriales bacterium]HMU13770.1 DUF6438 domain-containing protein [Flavobacteriales bacterium]HMW96669.1 DUF6438 domain-containing protein [Flavobacteriales bacterium]HMZ47536.1 DUF6438 domain-containing protein [Flavobacteriales bacterium]